MSDRKGNLSCTNLCRISIIHHHDLKTNYKSAGMSERECVSSRTTRQNRISLLRWGSDCLSSYCDLDSAVYRFKARWTIVGIDHTVIDCAHVETFC